MRSPVVLGIGVALLAVLSVAGWWMMPKDKANDTATSTPAISSLPRDTGAHVVLRTKSGRIVSVPDFTYGHPSVEVEDTGVTYVHITQNDDLEEADPRYGIVYGSDSTFILGLMATPLGATRLVAEQKLKEFVPLPDDILCGLSVSVRTADTIDARFAGRELGLSFCPGAVPLP